MERASILRWFEVNPCRGDWGARRIYHTPAHTNVPVAPSNGNRRQQNSDGKKFSILHRKQPSATLSSRVGFHLALPSPRHTNQSKRMAGTMSTRPTNAVAEPRAKPTRPIPPTARNTTAIVSVTVRITRTSDLMNVGLTRCRPHWADLPRISAPEHDVIQECERPKNEYVAGSCKANEHGSHRWQDGKRLAAVVLP